jgi:hypothetical protein
MKITAAVDLFCRPGIVFPWIADPDKAMRWQKGIKGGEIIKETPEKIGTTFREEMEENGKGLVMYGEITGYVQDKLMSFRLESKIHRVEVTYSIEWKDNRSILTAESIVHWKFPLNIISLFMGHKIKESISRRTESEFAELKRLCETNGS